MIALASSACAVTSVGCSPLVGFEPKVELGMIAPQIAIGVGGAVTADGESQVW